MRKKLIIMIIIIYLLGPQVHFNPKEDKWAATGATTDTACV